jgi:CheY-like chemotaxis protein
MDQSTILLIDDNEDDILLMQRAIQKANISNPIQSVSDGAQAIEYLKGEEPYSDSVRFPTPALLLLDLKMPRMTGFELLEWIRQQPKLKRLWVIVLTHSQERSDIDRAYDLGANSYLVKPSQFNSLVEIVAVLQRFWLQSSEKPDCTRPLSTLDSPRTP